MEVSHLTRDVIHAAKVRGGRATSPASASRNHPEQKHHHQGGGGSAGGHAMYMVVEKGPRDEASYTWNRLGLSINSSPALRHLLKPDEVGTRTRKGIGVSSVSVLVLWRVWV